MKTFGVYVVIDGCNEELLVASVEVLTREYIKILHNNVILTLENESSLLCA